MRVGYVPYGPNVDRPGDLRRFPFYARARGLDFELASPDGDYDVVVLSGLADIQTWARKPPGTKLVYELIDSYLALPRHDLKSLGRGVAKFASRETRAPTLNYRGAIEAMCRRADAVVCTTEEQRGDILPLCSNVHVILDAQDQLVGHVKGDWSIGETLNLVWEGLGVNLRWLSALAPVLEELRKERRVAMHLVTQLEFAVYANKFRKRRASDVVSDLGPDVFLYQWNQQTFSAIASACDIAVIPIPLDRPFEAGKPENKLLLFWRMGVPTVASPTPAYVRAMEQADQSLTCTGTREWVDTIRRLAGDQPERERVRDTGMRLARDEHSDEAVLSRWDGVFDSLALSQS